MADPSAPSGRAVLYKNPTTGVNSDIYDDSLKRKYPTLDAWYKERGSELLALAGDEELPPMGEELHYGYTEFCLNFPEVVEAVGGDWMRWMGLEGSAGAGAGAGAGAAAAVALPPPDRIKQINMSLTSLKQNATRLQEKIQTLVSEAQTVESVSALVSTATELKAVLEKKKELTIRFVELCVAEGDLGKGISMQLVEELADQMARARGM